MKRKVIQIAESTQLVSLPRSWSKLNNVKKGDEVEVEEKGSRLVISTQLGDSTERAEFDLRGLEVMSSRFIHALYKRGVDELKLTFDRPDTLEMVKNALGKETVGYEITDQTKTSCTIHNVSGELEEFDSILRRTFLMLNSLARDTYTELNEGDFKHCANVALLEEANNRFTTSLRRLLNKRGSDRYDKIGPIYYIIESLENLADQYKYLCQYMAKHDKVKLHADSLSMLNDANAMVEMYYHLFYKFDKDALERIGKGRKDMVKRFYRIIENADGQYAKIDVVLAHHSLNIAQKTFCLTGPYLVLSVKGPQT
jgi:phosphate uptake regulator